MHTPGELLAMTNDETLNLVDIPWPMSILQFNQVLGGMAPGDRLAVTLCDPDVRDNFRMMVNNLKGYRCSVNRSKGGWTIHIVRVHT